jgi:hypothetical protein
MWLFVRHRNGATLPQLMAIFDWSTPDQAMVYIEKANKDRMTRDAMTFLIAKGNDAVVAAGPIMPSATMGEGKSRTNRE